MGRKLMSTWADHAELTARQTDPIQLLIHVEANLEMLANRMQDRGWKKLASAIRRAQDEAERALDRELDE